MQDHEIFAITWGEPQGNQQWISNWNSAHASSDNYGLTFQDATFDDSNHDFDGGSIIDVANLTLSNGESVSPLVWSPLLRSPTGQVLKDVGLRVVNRTDFYRCREPAFEVAV